MTDLHELLDRASAGDSATDATADLARARKALRGRRRRLAAVAAVAAVVVAGVSIVSTRGGDDPATTNDLRLVAASVAAGPYVFGKLPDGWQVQGESPFAVTIAPPDATDQEPSSFLGKLVITYDQNPLSGETSSYHGRDFYTRDDSGHTTIAVATRPGEQEGEVLVQYPDSAGWDHDTMVEFLDAVHVTDAAQPGVG